MLALAKKKGIPLKESDFIQHPNWPQGPTLKMGKNGRCRFLQHSTGLCRIYAARPGSCRRFPHEAFPGCLLNDAETSEKHPVPVGPGVPRELK